MRESGRQFRTFEGICGRSSPREFLELANEVRLVVIAAVLRYVRPASRLRLEHRLEADDAGEAFRIEADLLLEDSFQLPWAYVQRVRDTVDRLRSTRCVDAVERRFGDRRFRPSEF